MKAELQFAPKKEIISIKCDYIDVMDACPRLTGEQAKIVLGAIGEQPDANVGIKGLWEVIRYTADALFPSE